MDEKGKAPEWADSEANEEKGKEYKNPSQTVYHEKDDSSIPKKNNFHYCVGLVEKNCAWCGKVYIPTRPEYAWGDCCSYTCCLRYDERRREALTGPRAVIMVHPQKGTDILKFDSTKAASDFAGVEARSIRNVCNGLAETSGGYAWRWADEEQLKPVDAVPDYVPEKKSCMTVWMRESMYKKLDELAQKNGVSRNRMVTVIVEKELGE